MEDIGESIRKALDTFNGHFEKMSRDWEEIRRAIGVLLDTSKEHSIRLNDLEVRLSKVEAILKNNGLQ